MDKPERTPAQKHLRALLGKIRDHLSDDKPSDILIIKAHLICEYYLQQILLLKEVCSAEEIIKLGFNDKLERSLDKGKENELKSYKGLKKLNKLRNRVGHELDYKVSESDVDDLGFLEGKDYVIEKYDAESLPELLRNTLLTIVIDLSLVVNGLVEKERDIRDKESTKDEKPKD